ncbi:MAG: DegT/DnrJ/EryC1/StrS family aminotransferase [Betaproteobacteria bacterium]|nr:DegT/DnrJ/EryC1/StrS family aminotransferase [Betaproteobacteria bacterium]
MDFIDLKTQYAALKTSIDARIQRVLDHGQYIMGPEVSELEEKLAAYTGAKNCITCASGTDALLISLMALDIGPGDEVITTPFTFVATAEVIVLAGAKPVFVDVQPDTANIDPRQIEAAITPRTRVIMPVALYGQPADMDEINAIAARHSLPVIEDAAQSFGATYKGRKSCNLSAIGCTSFFPSKPLGCYGDGGAIFTNDDDMAKAMREIRVHGQEKRYYHTRVGIGGRMDTIQCAVVLGKLERFEWELDQRALVAQRYRKGFANAAPAIEMFKLRPDRTSAYAQYTIKVQDRDKLEAALKVAGIPTAVHYPVPLHRQPAYAQWAKGARFPVSEQLASQVISLPMHADLGGEVQERIVGALKSCA